MSSNNLVRRNMRLALAAALVMILALPAGAAPADNGKSARRKSTACGGKWVGGADCKFRYAGGSIHIDAGFRSDVAGYVVLRLEALDPETGQRVLVTNCTTTGQFGACSTAASESPTVPLSVGQKLICTVKGMNRGTYRCSSDRR